MTSRQNYWEVSVSSIDLTQVDHKFDVRSIFMHFPAYVGLDAETLDFASRESTYWRQSLEKFPKVSFLDANRFLHDYYD